MIKITAISGVAVDVWHMLWYEWPTESHQYQVNTHSWLHSRKNQY